VVVRRIVCFIKHNVTGGLDLVGSCVFILDGSIRCGVADEYAGGGMCCVKFV